MILTIVRYFFPDVSNVTHDPLVFFQFNTCFFHFYHTCGFLFYYAIFSTCIVVNFCVLSLRHGESHRRQE